ncbi:MAG: DUF3108 domain-containing protein [Bdellovibrionales bacterium]
MDSSSLEMERNEAFVNKTGVLDVSADFKRIAVSMALSVCVACSSIMKPEKEEDIKLDSDIDKKVKIEEVQVQPLPTSESTPQKPPPPLLPPEKPKKKVSKAKAKSTESPGESVETSSPSIEDTEGFKGRRPLHDPFRVGEKITHEVYYNYFRFTAGFMTFSTLPFVQVNGRKAYQFTIDLKSASLFNSIYTVEDRVVTLVDYEHWLPRLFTLHVKESGQLREGRSYFDFQALRARYEEKKVSKKKGAEQKNQEWEILPYSQNVFSVIYYMRLFAWRDGKEYAFRVADDGDNLVFKGRVVEREFLKTDIGPIKAIKIKPEITVKGAFKPVGDIYIWLSDDERKLPLRIESKIKIGTIVSEITDYQPGNSN